MERLFNNLAESDKIYFAAMQVLLIATYMQLTLKLASIFFLAVSFGLFLVLVHPLLLILALVTLIVIDEVSHIR